MFRNYFKVALRNIKRYKTFSTINIMGLAISMSCVILIFLWVRDEITYDEFNSNLENIYRVVIRDSSTNKIRNSAVTPAPLAYVLKNEYPEITQITRTASGRNLIKFDNKSFDENEILYADPGILNIFSFPLIAGNIATALSDPHSLVITEDAAEKYFGREQAVGKIVEIKEKDFVVSGVLKNLPQNSTLKFNILIPFEYLREVENIDFWGAWRYYTYVQLKENLSIHEVNKKIAGIIAKHQPNAKSSPYLQPFQEIHLYSDLNYDIPGRSDIKYVWIFSSLALFITIIACINFMNLATAKFGIRSKEIGMRKVVGAGRKSLVLQFLGESVLLSFIALLIAVLIVELILPSFNLFSAKNLSLDFISSSKLYLGLIGLGLIIGILSGSYPAILISAFQPIQILKSIPTKRTFKENKNSKSGRNFLVVMQFTITIIFIISALIIANQLNYIKEKKLGFEKNYVVYIPMKGNLLKNYQTFKNKLIQDPNINNVTASFQLPTNIGSSPGEMEWEGKNPGQNVRINAGLIDYNYFETFEMEMALGRRFSKKHNADDSAAYILNETAIAEMAMVNPIGKWFSFWDTRGTIVGVVKDFHSQSLHKKINPIVLKIDSYWLFYVYARINSTNIAAAISKIEKTWKRFNPDYPFEYHFLDETIDKLYWSEQRMGDLFQYLTYLTLFIACLGLFGLSSFTTEQRIKEIGIRKALGASISGILILLSKEFVKWVIIANILAWPVAWFVMDKWLQNFAYRIQIDWWVFILSGSIALVISILTVSSQAIKTALTNPVESLRYE